MNVYRMNQAFRSSTDEGFCDLCNGKHRQADLFAIDPQERYYPDKWIICAECLADLREEINETLASHKISKHIFRDPENNVQPDYRKGQCEYCRQEKGINNLYTLKKTKSTRYPDYICLECLQSLLQQIDQALATPLPQPAEVQIGSYVSLANCEQSLNFLSPWQHRVFKVLWQDKQEGWARLWDIASHMETEIRLDSIVLMPYEVEYLGADEMKEKSVEDVLKDYHEEYLRWKHLLSYGGRDPFWPDGVNLNLVRNHMIADLKNLKELAQEQDIPELKDLPEVPPEVPENYVANAEEIMDKGIKLLTMYGEDPAYRYIKANAQKLNFKQHVELKVNDVINHYKNLEQAIQEADLVTIRRCCHNPEHYFESFTTCAKDISSIICDEGYQLTLDFGDENEELEI